MIIIKIGGGKNINYDAIVSDLHLVKEPFIIVHGGNYALDDIMHRFRIKKEMLISPDSQMSRYTTKEVIKMIYMSYCGLNNKTLVEKMQKKGINAIGLSGIDGKLVTGYRHKALLVVRGGKRKIIRNDMTGTVSHINISLINLLINHGFIPIITPPGLSAELDPINIDGDKIACQLAIELKAKLILFLIEEKGLLYDFHNKKSVIPITEVKNISSVIAITEGRMKKKLIICQWAIDKGVKKIIIADGRAAKPIYQAIVAKGGTTII